VHEDLRPVYLGPEPCLINRELDGGTAVAKQLVTNPPPDARETIGANPLAGLVQATDAAPSRWPTHNYTGATRLGLSCTRRQ